MFIKKPLMTYLNNLNNIEFIQTGTKECEHNEKANDSSMLGFIVFSCFHLNGRNEAPAESDGVACADVQGLSFN